MSTEAEATSSRRLKDATGDILNSQMDRVRGGVRTQDGSEGVMPKISATAAATPVAISQDAMSFAIHQIHQNGSKAQDTSDEVDDHRERDEVIIPLSGISLSTSAPIARASSQTDSAHQQSSAGVGSSVAAGHGHTNSGGDQVKTAVAQLPQHALSQPQTQPTATADLHAETPASPPLQNAPTMTTIANLQQSQNAPAHASAQLNSMSGANSEQHLSTAAPKAQVRVMPHFSHVGLIGRRKEIRLIQGALDSVFRRFEARQRQLLLVGMMTSEGSIETDLSLSNHNEQPTPSQHQDKATKHQNQTARIFISLEGDAGNGKTSLALHSRLQCLERHGIFVHTRCEEASFPHAPLSMMRAMMFDICTQVSQFPNTDSAAQMQSGGDSEHDDDDDNDGSNDDPKRIEDKDVGTNTTERATRITSKSQSRSRSKTTILNDPRNYQTLQQRLTAELSSCQQRALVDFMPSCQTIFNPIVTNQSNESSSNTGITPTSPPESATTQTQGTTNEKVKAKAETHRVVATAETHIPNGHMRNFNRLRYALQRFLQILCDISPIIIVVDNMEYADGISLDLLQSWLVDTNIPALLVIGCHKGLERIGGGVADVVGADDTNHSAAVTSRRTSSASISPLTTNASQGLSAHESNNNGDGNDPTPLHQMLLAVDAVKRERSLKIHKMKVHPFALPHIHAYTIALLFPIERSFDFATMMLDRTGGNVYTSQQYIGSLVEDRSLYYDMNEMAWKWTIPNAPPQTSSFQTAAPTPAEPNETSSIDLLDILHQKMAAIEASPLALAVAACLGFRFRTRDLLYAIQHVSSRPQLASIFDPSVSPRDGNLMKDDLHEILEKCCHAGLIFHCEDSPDYDGVESKAQQRLRIQPSADDNDDDAVATTANEQDPSIETEHCFMHETIREAALCCVAPGKVGELLYHVGEALVEHLSPAELSKQIDFVANALNARSALESQQQQRRRQQQQDDGDHDHVNTDDGRRTRAMQVNYEAGLRAQRYSAFGLALHYFETAIQLLPTGDQTHQQPESQMIINLNSMAAECAYNVADFELARRYCSQVMGLPCPAEHKRRACLIQIHIAISHANRLQVHSQRAKKSMKRTRRRNSARRKSLSLGGAAASQDPVELCRRALARLGFNLPKGQIQIKVATMRGVAELNKMAQKWNGDMIDHLKVCDGPRTSNANDDPNSRGSNNAPVHREVMISELLHLLSIAANFSKPNLLPLILTKHIRRTLDHGITEHSAPAFALQGLMAGYLVGNFHLSRKYGEAALKILDRFQNPIFGSQSMFMLYDVVLHWTASPAAVRRAHLEGHEIGMRIGDVDSAMWNLLSYMRSSFMSGAPLTKLDEDISEACKLMKDFDQSQQHTYARMMWQLVMNLRGVSKQTVKLNGEAFTETENDAPNETDPAFLMLSFHQLFAATFFDDHEIGANIAVKTTAIRLKIFPGSAQLPSACFLGGLCCYIVYGGAAEPKSKRRRSSRLQRRRHQQPQSQRRQMKQYARTAQKCLKQLQTWESNGSPNCRYAIRFLEAENEAIKGHFDKATRLYREAIGVAKQAGWIHFQALANERLLACHSKRGDDAEELRLRYDECIRLYTLWEADAKVEQLRKSSFANLLHPPARG